MPMSIKINQVRLPASPRPRMVDAEESSSEPVPANGHGHFDFAYQSWKSLSPEFTRIRKVQKRAREAWEKMLLDQDSITAKLESRWKQLEYQAKLLKKREDQFHVEEHRRILEKERISEIKRANSDLLRLKEDQKRENNRLHERIIRLKKQLEGKQALELEVKRMKELNETLLLKEQKSNQEQSEVLSVLIRGFEELRKSSCVDFIGVKRIGELDRDPFLATRTRQKLSNLETLKPNEEAWSESFKKAFKLFHLWEDYLWNPSWKPFKIITVEGSSKEIIDEEDEKLKALKSEYGGKVYVAVINALTEINKYKPISRYENKELWNHREGRKATLREVVSHILEQWRLYEQKRY